ncbi:MAG: hypothetical protein ACHQC8_02630 [Solirubrobacterales bacterium]
MNEGDEMVVHVVVYVNVITQKFRTEVNVDEGQPEVIRLVAAMHATRDLLEHLAPGVLEG